MKQLFREEALSRQASLLDLSRDAIFTRSADDLITYWNRGAQIMYRYSREEALGRNSHALLRTRFPLPLPDIHAYLQQHRYWEGELVQLTKDDRELTVFSRWVLDSHKGRPLRYLETNTDITHRAQAERALRQTQEDLRLLIEGATEHAILMLDPDGFILNWNAGAERIVGMPAQRALGRHFAELFTAEDREVGEPLRELEQARAGGRSGNKRWHLRSDGSRFWACSVVTPLRRVDGSLRGYAKIMHDQTAERLAEEQTRFLANHDELTGLPNRVNFSNQLHAAIAASKRSGVPFALLLLDLDRFKYVNDTFGHHTGDLLLKEVALRIVSSIRETDFVARLGGDEFVIIQDDVSQPDASQTLARKLVLELGRPFQLEGQEVISGASIGLCVFPADGDNPVELLKRADLALYRAKHAGRHTYQFYSFDLHAERSWKRNREEALRVALKNKQFELYYQPLVDLDTWKISTVEALLRWNATKLETVLPADFLGIVEQNGLIIDIGAWALREAAHQVRRWQARGLSGLRLSVNCSARQFGDAGFVALIPSILRDSGLAPDSLQLEVPESMLARHPAIKERLSGLREQGIRLTIDNFGTGATALIDFKEFAVDAVKIDKAFVQHLPHRRADSAIASAIISLAHNLGIAVIAGGVETAEQLAYLKARECNGAQGFIFSPPVPAHEFEQLMLSGQWSRINRLSQLDA
jgi:diguanylate cyclase (GGDEF)-like protein/PAS domain S-box-containing protein